MSVAPARLPEVDEPILDPDIPIIDPHYHMWSHTEQTLRWWDDAWADVAAVVRAQPRHLLEEALVNLTSGHHFVATLYEDASQMHRTTGPEELRPLGEIEFATGIAAMSASGLFGSVRVAAGILGEADLSIGARVEDVLQEAIAISAGRFRGIRSHPPENLADHADYRAGMTRLGELGLVCNLFTVEPNLPSLIEVAELFPGNTFVVEHAGGPVVGGEREKERFPFWRESVRRLSELPNVRMEVGALSIPFNGPTGSWKADPPFGSEEIAAEWRPFAETVIELFGPSRTMFESDFPYMAGACSYRVLWNVFKRLAAGASRDEKVALCSGTAAETYRIEL